LELTIEGNRYELIPIKDFRAMHRLPPTFNINLFESKDYTGLAQIDSAGAAINQIRTTVMAALPKRLLPMEWLSFLPQLTHIFEAQLRRINDQVGLRDVEIEFAVAGFNDALQAYAYSFIYACAAHTPFPDFQAVYTEWLNGTVRLYAKQHAFMLDDETCTVQVIAHAYGRIGLLIRASQVYAVYDPMLVCPAEGFMTKLLIEVAAHMRRASS
jgi:hypothetical protein